MIRNQGFSLLEIIIVIALFSLVATITTGFLSAIMLSSNKAEIEKKVRQNGNYALSVMEGMILNSRSVSCVDTDTIQSIDLQGVTTTFECNDGQDRIASIAALPSGTTAPLTGLDVRVSSCQFSCEEASGLPTKVHLEFTVQQRSTDARASEKSSIEFQTEVVPRNIN